jgi:hypothetical protein
MSFRSRLRRSVVVSISSTHRGFMPSAVVPAIRAKYKLRYRTSKGKLRKTSRVDFNFPNIYGLRLEFERLDAIICLILLALTCVKVFRLEAVFDEAFFTGAVLAAFRTCLPVFADRYAVVTSGRSRMASTALTSLFFKCRSLTISSEVGKPGGMFIFGLMMSF